MKQLILGGARSGKSKLAEQHASASHKKIVYVATAQPGDDEMRARIRVHQVRRPKDWRLVEEPIRLARVLNDIAKPDTLVLIDCLTLWLTNLLCDDDHSLLSQERDALLSTLPKLPGSLIMVSNEVGSGVIPLGKLNRDFVDQAGLLHQALASHCDQVVLCVAGLPHYLKRE